MSSGKYLSFEDVRRNPKLFERFAKEHPAKADRARFEALLAAVCPPPNKPSEGDQT